MSNFARTVLLICAILSVPTAPAEEDNQSSYSNDRVILSDKPRDIRPALAPPSDHWIYKLPNQEQTKIVTLTVTVLDHQRRPVPGAKVLACCEPWSFITSANTDNSGRISLRGPIGDWSIYAGSATKTSGLLASLSNIKVQQDTAVSIQAEKEIQWRPVTPDGRPFPLDGRTELNFMPVDLVGDEQNVPDSETVNVEQIQGLRGVGTILPCGRLIKGVIRLSVTPTCTGVLSLAQDPGDNHPGLFLWQSVTTQSSRDLVIDTKKMGRLVVSFDGYRVSKARAIVNVERRGTEGGEASAVIWIPTNGGRYTFFTSPGEYAVRVAVNGAQYVPRRIRVAPDQEQTLAARWQISGPHQHA